MKKKDQTLIIIGILLLLVLSKQPFGIYDCFDRGDVKICTYEHTGSWESANCPCDAEKCWFETNIASEWIKMECGMRDENSQWTGTTLSPCFSGEVLCSNEGRYIIQYPYQPNGNGDLLPIIILGFLILFIGGRI